ncbi:MAG: MFS transporter, partial [Thermoplasmata archaeon]
MKNMFEMKGLSSKYRWVILIILLATVMIAFMGRLSTSVALNAIGEDLVWSQADTGFLGGILMGIFLVSYGFSNIILSQNIDKYGSKIVLFCSMVGCSFAVFLGGYYGHVYSLFLLSRLLLGLTQGVLFPLAAKVIAGWYTVQDRGKANAIFMLGAPIGVALAPIIMGPIIHRFAWNLSFYVVALMGFALAVPIFLFIE